ncbi:MAG: T9SS type A sorting domain-containing protein, partial [bacterium]
GVIYGTVNGGATWQQNFSSSSQNLRSVFALDGRHAWAVGLNNTILKYDAPHQVPIQLASFNASVSNNHDVRLAWRTISEVNNYGFEVQRAFGEAEGFESIDGSFVPGHGTTNQPQNYSWTDNNAPAGHLYYRLKQIDLDGTTSYTEPVSVDVLTAVGEAGVATAYSLNQNYPNPFNPVTTIQFSITSAELANLKIFDMLGREVATLVNEVKQPGIYRVQWDANNFPSGMYFYKLTTERFSETRKLTLVR